MKKNLIPDFLLFLRNSPTPFHATQNLKSMLESAGFEQILEKDEWSLKNNGKYFVIRGDSSLIAIELNRAVSENTGFLAVGAHTDSPCLKLKPNATKERFGYLQLNTEVYGGVLLNPWFDRDLSIAGKIVYKTKTGQIKTMLIDCKKPLAVLSSLAIHLDREANKKRSIDKQKMLSPILAPRSEGSNFQDLLISEIKKKEKIKTGLSLLTTDLFMYDTQAPAVTGMNDDFVSSARLDNLVSCFYACRALIDSKPSQNKLLICNDHEEVGSQSYIGAKGNFFKDVLGRVCKTPELYSRAIASSMLVSADNAHGLHPNFPERHDENHRPIINSGVVIKINNNQAYASNADTCSIIQNLAEKRKIPIQYFISNNEMACGSTIGPITATALGVKTVDLGLPTFAMHSIRELCGVKDIYSFYKLLLELYQEDLD
ncbi:MAG: M18 family aminopeptidase [Methylococcaceae bacterium TMED69]|mgnify:CR=1 FL=1|nr:MAG: M18 family aminopeptidase [Methylococcaceae bacterium TMED69]|tara:strand:+ start:312 stop:1598 length:1287 start_codon:yes stop_codon:yes gene_type:complete